MTKVDFYILKGTSVDERFALVCRLAEKAISRNQKLFIHTEDKETAAMLDKMLWTFRAESFIPHKLLVEGAEPCDEAVVIASDVEPDSSRPVLINLASSVPFFFSRFERTLEIINDQAEIKAQARDRWGFYKDRGYPLQHHKL